MQSDKISYILPHIVLFIQTDTQKKMLHFTTYFRAYERQTDKICYISLLIMDSKYDRPTGKFEKRLLLRCIHHFKSDLINNMDHMRISGNEPSSVILSETKCFQTLKTIARKCLIKIEQKGMVY